MNLVPYDDDLIEAVAWKLAQRDGYKYGRGPVEKYIEEVRDIIVALEVAAEEREADPEPDQ